MRPAEGLRFVYVWDADYPWDVRTEKICRALTDAGADVHIVARNRAWSPTEERLPEGTVHRMAPWRSVGRALDGALGFPAFFNPRWLKLLAETVKRVSPDAIIVRDLPLCPTAITIGRRHGVPVILDMAENYPAMINDIWSSGRQKPWDILARNPRLVSAVERWCVHRLDQILVVVEESGERLQREHGVRPEKLAVVSNTPPSERVSPSMNGKHAGDGRLEIVYLGLMEIPRGVAELLRAVAILRDRRVPVRLRLVGDGRDLDLFQKEANDLQLGSDDVVFLGRLPHAAALETVATSQVGVVPHHEGESWNTTIPNKLFDYMAAGLAVVSSDTIPCTRIIEETHAGLIFESGDPASLADALGRLANNELRRDCAENGRKAILERYNWQTDVAELIRAVKQSVAERSHVAT